jgi:hypothetical protein
VPFTTELLLTQINAPSDVGALVVLDRSLDSGRYADYVQWETFRKARSVMTNIAQAGSGGLGDVIGAYERNWCWISKVPTHSFWFSRFMAGIHKRVGEIRRQDEALSIDVLMALNAALESRWLHSADLDVRRRVAEMGTWFNCGFCTGLRGEEMVRIEFAGTAKSVDRWMSRAVDPFFMLVVTGRTKGNQLSGAKFSVPCVKITEGTSLRPGKWVGRLVAEMRRAGIRSGRLFQRKLDPPRMGEWEDDFMTILELVQSTTEFIENEIDVRDKYGMARSIRRGATAHARNMCVDEDLIKAVQRWSKDATGAARLDMIELYSDADVLTPTYLRYSRAF